VMDDLIMSVKLEQRILVAQRHISIHRRATSDKFVTVSCSSHSSSVQLRTTANVIITAEQDVNPEFTDLLYSYWSPVEFGVIVPAKSI